jgi:hypothetical protein
MNNTMDPTTPSFDTTDTTAPTDGGGMDAAEMESDRRIRDAKRHLSQRLDELERRFAGLKENIDPRAWVPNPWARAGIAFGVGFILGRTHIIRPILGAVFTAAASAVVKDFVSRQLAAADE